VPDGKRSAELLSVLFSRLVEHYAANDCEHYERNEEGKSELPPQAGALYTISLSESEQRLLFRTTTCGMAKEICTLSKAVWIGCPQTRDDLPDRLEDFSEYRKTPRVKPPGEPRLGAENERATKADNENVGLCPRGHRRGTCHDLGASDQHNLGT
jgi:hypothetical protein